ncbi:MAG: Gfo/Idh/MocA family oxidoreductase [Caulobacteraceae bacterium]|nr:Gfo/Idh/MocA family oxidoreductase [Caulobacteraceae bacterium]
MRFAIIGCGLIGAKRADAIAGLRHQLVVAADLDRGRADVLAARYGGRATDDWRAALAADGVDAVIVATAHDALSAIAVGALEAGKHVLVEKPAGRNLSEVEAIAAAAARGGKIVKVGYNHRFHPSILKARSLVDAGELGPLMFVRGRYGHGGRIGYEQEWRLKRDISGGGELIDQGSHLIDLAHWFLGDFTAVFGQTRNYFWAADTEDNAFLTLSTSQGAVAWLHASWTEWKNMFSFEIYGRDGKIEINGLGGSYGIESLALYKMLPQMGPPETTKWEWPFPDVSWRLETAEFIDAIGEGRRAIGDIEDAAHTMSVIDQVYRGSGQ